MLILNQQLAVKCLDVDELAGSEDATMATAQETVRGEVYINQLVSSTQCTHVTRYRGHGARNWTAHVAKGFDKGRRVTTFDRQDVLIYQDFAGCGSLDDLIENHKDKKR